MSSITKAAQSATVALLAIIAGIVANIILAGQAGPAKLGAWILTLVAMVLLSCCIGKAISNQWSGAVLSARNRISLSRLQMLAWTLVIISTLVTAAASNFAVVGSTAALKIVIQNDLLAAMGIAATSLAAAPAILSLKGAGGPIDGQAVLPAVHTRALASEASWLDIFRGDEEGNYNTPDLSKIQQFLITLALLGIYVILIGEQFLALKGSALFEAFPPLGQSFIWLLGISHAGYLTYKAVPHPTAKAPAAAARAAATGAG